MKKTFSIVTVIALLLTVCLLFASCAAGTTDGNGIRYGYNEETEEYTVIGYNGTQSALTIPSEYEGKAVTAIGANAFANNTALVSVTLPKSVKTLGDGAFAGCTELSEVIFAEDGAIEALPDGFFSGCVKLGAVVLPDSIKEIGYKAFENCTGMSSAKLSQSLEFIDYYAFSGCINLSTLTLGSPRFTVCANAFFGCKALNTLVTPECKTDADRAAKYTYIDGLLTDAEGTRLIRFLRPNDTEYTLPAGIKSIEAGAFYGQYKLTVIKSESEAYKDVDGVLYTADGKTLVAYPAGKSGETFSVPSGVTAIAGSAFNGTQSITELILPNSLESIGNGAFSGCLNLKTLTTDVNKIAIGPDAFLGCRLLESYTVKDANVKTAMLLEGRVLFSADGKTLVSYSADLENEEYTVPAAVKSIEAGAFSNNSKLKTIKADSANADLSAENGVLYNKDKTALLAYPANKQDASFTVPETVKTLAAYAFRANANLTELTLPAGCKELTQGVFENCTALRSLTIKAVAVDVRMNAFNGCDALENITFHGSESAWVQAKNNAAAGNDAIFDITPSILG